MPPSDITGGRRSTGRHVRRDAQEDSSVLSRLDQARVERVLAEHDPFREVV
jgi:hypothetical protein